jgi:hypothetical protein
MTRFLNAASPSATAPSHGTSDPPRWQIDDKILGQIGLKPPPADPKLLGAFLAADDRADADSDADEFARGIRRAVRLNLALSAGLHRQARQPWREWVEAHFKFGYACFNRYHVAAELQIGLMTRGLPRLINEHQSRSIAPFRRHDKFWTALATFEPELPPAAELKSRLRAALGLGELAAGTTPRIKLHRLLQRIAAATPRPEDDPAVREALALVRLALGVLEKGGTNA